MAACSVCREGRTATAVASTPVSAFALDRVSFLAVVNGHAPTPQVAVSILCDLSERDLLREMAQKERDPP